MIELNEGESAHVCLFSSAVSNGQLDSNLKNFCPESLLEGRAEISVIFGWYFGRNDDLINSFWI